MTRHVHVLAVVAVFLAGAEFGTLVRHPALAQGVAPPAPKTKPGSRPSPPVVIRLDSSTQGFPQNMSPTDGMDLLRAERALRDGDAESALRLFQRLWDRGVRDPRVVIGLGESLLALHRDARLDSLATAGRSDPQAGPYLEILAGEALARQDKKSEAEAKWRDAVRRAPKEARLELLETVGGYEASHAMWDDLIKTWLEARDVAGNRGAYAKNLGDAYLAAGRKVDAVNEFLTVLDTSPSERAYAQAQLEGIFADEPSLRKPALKRLREDLRDNPERFDLSEIVVAWSMAAGECDQAVTEAVRREKVAPSGGAYLLVLAESARSSGCSGVAARAWKELTAIYGSESLSPGVKLGLARLLEESGQRGEAADAYLKLAREEPRSRETAEALARAADLMLGTPGRGEEALSIYEKMKRDYPSLPEGRRADLRAAEAMLALGRVGPAQERLDGLLAGKDLAPEDEERARYLRARLLYFKGDFDGAHEELDQVVEQFSRGETVNDCLDLLFFLDLASESPADLKKIADADFLVFRGELDQADRLLDPVASQSGPLAPEAAWRRAGIARRSGHAEAGLVLLETVAKQGEEPLRARALEEAAAIARDDLHDAARARTYLERLLTEQPDSPFADRARRTLDALPRNLP